MCRSVLSNPKYKKSEFAEALKHIMENIDRISQPDWQPTSADILHCRHRTVGTLETRVPVLLFVFMGSRAVLISLSTFLSKRLINTSGL